MGKNDLEGESRTGKFHPVRLWQTFNFCWNSLPWIWKYKGKKFSKQNWLF